MKLKKFAALALAGVMAVSMLAGCASKPAEKPTEEPTTGVTVAAVNGALSEATTKMVTFTESASLKTALDSYIQYKGVDAVLALKNKAVSGDAGFAADMSKFYTDLPQAWYFNAAASQTSDTESVNKATGITRMVVLTNVGDLNDSAIVKQIVAGVEKLNVQESGLTLAGLNKTSGDMVATDGSKYYYSYSYTGDMAISKVTKLDGTVNYVVLLTVTRTPAKTAAPER